MFSTTAKTFFGHRSIGYIHGVECRDDCERFRAYAKTLERNGLPIDARFLLYADFEEIKAYEEVRKFLMRERDIPDAFFCANDEMAGGCMRALAESFPFQKYHRKTGARNPFNMVTLEAFVHNDSPLHTGGHNHTVNFLTCILIADINIVIKERALS